MFQQINHWLKINLLALFEPNSKEIDSLHGLRAISILLIVILHLYIPAGPFLNVPFNWIDRFLRNFTSGVDLFFILSGFLIYGKLRSTEKIKPTTLRIYFEKRARRILPAYYTALIGAAIYLVYLTKSLKGDLLHNVQMSLSSSWADVLFVSNYLPKRLLDLGWSLSIEAHFYLLVPLFVYLIQKIGARFRRMLPIVMLSIFYFLPLCFRLIQIDNNMTYFYSHTRLDSIIAGMIVAELYFQGWLTKLSNWASFVVLFVSMIILTIGHLSEIDSLFYRTVRYNFFNVGFSGLLILALYSSVVQRWLSISPFRYLARMSYTIYLWHPLLIALVLRQFYISPEEIDLIRILLIWLFSFIITIVLSTFLYWLIEKPFQYSKAPNEKLNT